MIKIFQLFLLCMLTFNIQAYDELTEVDPYVEDYNVNGRKITYTMGLTGSPWLLDDVKKVCYYRRGRITKKFKSRPVCCSSKREFHGSEDYLCSFTKKWVDHSMKAVITNKHNKVRVYFKVDRGERFDVRN